MYCRNCGKELNENAKFCENCGTPTQAKIAQERTEIHTANKQSIPTKQARQNVKKANLKDMFIGLGILILISALIFGIILFVEKDNLSIGSSNKDKPQLLSRQANINDIVIDSTLDLSSFGGKYTILPQSDISNLEITINYLDKNKNILISETKYLGNAKKGVQINFSISLFELGVSVAYNTRYESITVTGGTVSYFA